MSLLTRDHFLFFARNGYLQVSDLLTGEVCEALVGLTQQQFPADWAPADPGTWLGEVRDSCHAGSLEWFKGALKYQGLEVREAPVASAAFSLGSPLANVAQELIGAPLASHVIRGLYPIFPVPHASTVKPRYPHVESHPVELVAFAYLDDVGPGGAGLSVWPGSHRDIYPTMESKLDFARSEQFDDVYDQWASLHPIELEGKRGDVFFTHHRLLHGPSVNRSMSIRYALLCDYKREGWEALCQEGPTEDVWVDWPALAALDAAALAAPADFKLERRPWKARDAARVTADYTNSPAALRKQDAATLASLRRAGDFWLQASDSGDVLGGVRLTPRGTDLKAAGVKMWVDGEEVTSCSTHDIFHRLTVLGRPVRVQVTGAHIPIHFKIVRLALPFASSEIVGLWTTDPADETPEFFFHYQPDTKPIAQCSTASAAEIRSAPGGVGAQQSGETQHAGEERQSAAVVHCSIHRTSGRRGGPGV